MGRVFHIFGPISLMRVVGCTSYSYLWYPAGRWDSWCIVFSARDAWCECISTIQRCQLTHVCRWMEQSCVTAIHTINPLANRASSSHWHSTSTRRRVEWRTWASWEVPNPLPTTPRPLCPLPSPPPPTHTHTHLLPAWGRGWGSLEGAGQLIFQPLNGTISSTFLWYDMKDLLDTSVFYILFIVSKLLSNSVLYRVCSFRENEFCLDYFAGSGCLCPS